MAHILENQVIINGVDIWTRFGAFLTEEKKGGRENLTAILTPSKVKEHVGVDFREQSGKKYSDALKVANAERDVTLHFAQYADSRQAWLSNYTQFIDFLKKGYNASGATTNGWLSVNFPGLGLTLRMFYVDSTAYRPLTYLWRDGVQASSYRVRFREPVPII